MGHEASVRENDPEGVQGANLILVLVLERMPRISCIGDRAPERNVAPTPAVLQLLRMLDNRLDLRETFFYL